MDLIRWAKPIPQGLLCLFIKTYSNYNFYEK